MPSLRSRRVVIDHEVRPATIRHEDGVISEIGEGPADDDFGDLVVMPGLVDSHVHVNEPGRTEWEGFATASAAAAAGGTTTMIDMPLNSIPPTVDLPALRVKQESARGKLSVDTAFWGGLIPGSSPAVPELVKAGVCGFKAFMVNSGVDEFPPLDPSELEEAMRLLATTRVPLLLHAEDPETLVTMEESSRSYTSYLSSRPTESEAGAVARASELATATGTATHILHVSSGSAVDALGPGVTAETCPHYLTFCAEEIPDGATAFKCAPPIRGADHRDALWAALERGDVSMVVSDHSPAPAEIKEVESGDFLTAWGGIGSLQLRLPAVWTGAVARGIGVTEVARWLSTDPARLAGLDHYKGALVVGKDADFVVFDPDQPLVVRGVELEHRHPITPYEGMTLRGSVVTTVLRGETVFGDGRVVPGLGAMLERHD